MIWTGKTFVKYKMIYGLPWASYSETTWAVGIAQLTHYEGQVGGKFFAPTADRVMS